MSDQAEGAGVSLSRRQGIGCLAIAAFSLAGAALCLVLGALCMGTRGFFDCIGLLTVFPAVFAVAGLASAAVGLQRFTSAGSNPESRRAPAGLAGAWQTVQPLPPTRMPSGDLPPVIHLPGASEPEPSTQNEGESEQA